MGVRSKVAAATVALTLLGVSARAENGPPIIVAEQVALEGHSWAARLTAEGILSIDTPGKTETLRVSKGIVMSLLSVIRKARFSDLAPSYGVAEEHAPVRRITVSVDGRSTTVALLSLLDSDRRPDEVRRALYVAIAIRDLFDVEGAYDSRPDDRDLLTKLEGPGKGH